MYIYIYKTYLLGGNITLNFFNPSDLQNRIRQCRYYPSSYALLLETLQ